LFDLGSLQATLQPIQLLQDLLCFVPQDADILGEALRGLRRRARFLGIRRRSVGRGNLIAWHRDGLGRDRFRLALLVNAHRARGNEPRPWCPFHEAGSPLTFQFPGAKHLAHASRGDAEHTRRLVRRIVIRLSHHTS
jgi:hypothetical protein